LGEKPEAWLDLQSKEPTATLAGAGADITVPTRSVAMAEMKCIFLIVEG
jgi:hypothetical protein